MVWYGLRQHPSEATVKILSKSDLFWLGWPQRQSSLALKGLSNQTCFQFSAWHLFVKSDNTGQVKNLLDLIFRTVIYVCRLLFLYKTKREPVCCLYVCDFSDITHKKKTSPSSSHLAELFVVYSPWIMENSRNSVLR